MDYSINSLGSYLKLHTLWGLRASIFTDNIQMIVIGVLLFILISIISSSSGDNFSFSLINEKNPQLISSNYIPGYTLLD